MDNHNTSILLSADESDKGQVNGTVYRKQIARFGTWVNPLYPFFSEDRDMVLDKDWANEMIANFNKKLKRVPVPIDHTDMARDNAGEVIKLELSDDDSGLDAYIDVRDEATAKKIDNGLIFDVSMSFDWDYTDTKTGKHHGVVLIHVALVNEPYLTGMKPFENIKDAVGSLGRKFGLKVAGLAKGSTASVIMLSESKAKELSQMQTATVKNDKDFEVTITVKDEDGEEVERVLKAGEEAEVPAEQAEDVLKQINEATEAGDGDEGGDDDASDEGDGEGSDDEEAGDGDDEGEGEGEDEEGEEDDDKQKSELTRTKELLAEYQLSEKYNSLLEAGKITPAQKDKFMALAKLGEGGTVQLSAGNTVNLAELVTEILEAGPKVAKFSEGGSSKDGEDEQDEATDKKPSEQLSEGERAGMQAVGADPKRYDELSEKYPQMRVSTPSDSKQDKNKE